MRKPSHIVVDESALIDRLRAKRELPPPGERRRIRIAAGASLRDVARELDVSHTAVRRWETKSVPRESRIAYIRLLEQLRQLANGGDGG
jgi:DNA-binding transcriptional regulator YiaG